MDAPCVAPAYPEEVLDRGLFDSAIAADLNGDGLPDLVVSGPRVHLAESPSGYAAAQDLGGAYLGHVVALDLDGDGDLDLAGTASPDPASPFVIVHLNDGSGSFPASSTFLLPGIGEALVAADLNGDGLPDLACTLPDSDEVAVLLGSSGGGFLAASTYAAGTDPEHLVRGDLDGDGLDDLVVTTAGGEVAVLLNTGGGTFPTRVPYSVGPDLRGVEAADLDDDGDLDLVVASYGSMDLFVLENAGDGSFPLLHPMGLAARPLNVAVGDLYQNGRADVVLGVPGPPALDTYEVWVLEKLGPGIMDFAAARKRIVQSQPWSLSVVDLEGDDDLDLLVRNAPWAGGEVFRILNHGQGSLQVADVYAIPAYSDSAWAGPLDADGLVDLAVLTGNSQQSTPTIQIRRNLGDGQLAVLVEFAARDGSRSIVGGDFDHDGDNDLATANAVEGSLSVFVNSGNGVPSAELVLPLNGKPSELHVADLDLDGNLDLIATSQRIDVLWGDGAGGFSQPFEIAGVSTLVGHFVPADLDGDGLLDLAYILHDYVQGGVYGVLNLGGRTFSPSYPLGGFGEMEAIDAGDVDNDGDVDLVVWDSLVSKPRLYENQGGGTFVVQTLNHLQPNAHHVQLRDVDGDGRLDLVIAANLDLFVLLGGPQGFEPTYHFDYTPGSNRRPCLADFNNDGRLDVVGLSNKGLGVVRLSTCPGR